MQFKVPQNIDLEDKIIGPLTMGQFLYVLVGGMTDYILLQTLFPTNPAAFFAIALPIGLFSMAMAFLKINDIAFPRFVQAAILYMMSPKMRIWKKQIDITTPVRIEAPKKDNKPKMIKKKIDKSEIEKLASVLDTAGWAAVRDQQLKTFVNEFDEKHHSLSNPNTKAQIPNQVQNPKKLQVKTG